MVEKQQILIQKNLTSFIAIKARCSMTHLKQQKSLGFFYSTPLGHGCNIWLLLHPRPSDKTCKVFCINTFMSQANCLLVKFYPPSYIA